MYKRQMMDHSNSRQFYLPRVWRAHARGRCFQLMVSLIALILLTPFSSPDTPRPDVWLSALSTVVLLSGLYAVSNRRLTLLIGSILVLPTVINLWVFHDSYGAPMHAVRAITSMVFYLFMLAVILHYVFDGKRITDDKLYGVISVYLLAGLMFAWVYVLLEFIQPGSFHVNDYQNPDGVLNWTDLLYFSFVTLTTLGYGDITPITHMSRAVAIVEAICGIMYVAVMVAGIVGSLAATSSRFNPDGD